MEKKLKPFDLEAAKAGAKVITRDGRPVRIICFDRKNKNEPIVALVNFDYGEQLCTFTINGKYSDDTPTGYDLFMAPIKREGWVNLYKSKDCLAAVGNPFVYDTEEMAKSMVGTDSARKEFIATVKIEWEE